MQKQLQNSGFLVLLIILVLTLIPMAGMMSGYFTVLMGLSWVLALTHLGGWFSSNKVNKQQNSELSLKNPWLAVWLSATLLCAVHFVFGPAFTKIWLVDLIPEATWINQISGTGAFSSLRFKVLNWWAFFSVMWLVCFSVSRLSVRQVKVLLTVILAVSFGESVFGLVLNLSNRTSVLGLWEKQYYVGSTTGTFVNKNHFAGFLAICWPLVLGSLLSQKPLILSGYSLSLRFAVAFLYSSVVLFALVSSTSRMGLTVGVLGVFGWWLLNQVRVNGRIGLNALKTGAMVALGLTVLTLWFGAAETVSRFTQLEQGDGRLSIWSGMFSLPFTAWLLGVSPGGFGTAMDLVKPASANITYSYAHNDYLELVLELGLAGVMVFIASLVYWWNKVFTAGVVKEYTGVRLAALASVSTMILHSVVDFNLQIPASALFFWVSVDLLVNINLNQQIPAELLLKKKNLQVAGVSPSKPSVIGQLLKPFKTQKKKKKRRRL